MIAVDSSVVIARSRSRRGDESLRAAGLSEEESTLYVAEGLIMYLSEERVRRLFESLSALGAPQSSIVTNFGIGFGDDDRGIGALVRRGLIALRGELFKFALAKMLS